MLRPRWCLYGGLPPLGPGRVLGLRQSRLAAGRNLQRQCHANPLSSDGHSKSETSTHHTLPSPSWAVGFSVAAKKKAGSRSSSYGSAETTAPVREFWPTYVSWGLAGRAVGEPHAATGYRCGPEDAEQVLNSLSVQQQPGSFILGQSLRRRDHDVPTATIPGNLQAPCGGVEVQDGR